MLVALASCATNDAPDFGGSWRPANRYAEAPEAIPLHALYRYQAMPMDRTLRTMLARWAADTGRKLDYRHPYDFTLHAPVARIAATHVEDAVVQVSAAFAGERVSVTADAGSIVVQAAAVDSQAPAGSTAMVGAAVAPAGREAATATTE